MRYALNTVLMLLCILVCGAFLIKYVYDKSETQQYLRSVAQCQFFDLGDLLNEKYFINERYIDEADWVSKISISEIKERCTEALTINKESFTDILGASYVYKKIDDNTMLIERVSFSNDQTVLHFPSVLKFKRGKIESLK